MSEAQAAYPVIDLFAGPGGLGEGFASFSDTDECMRFRNAVSIESDDHAHRTLLLRHFFRSFHPDEIPDDYYEYLAGNIEIESLFAKHSRQYEEARLSALRLSLGPDSHERVRKAISQRLGNAKKWVLVGGPPCQAYSLVGRSRMRGRADFEEDERHFLYREYLRIIIDHRPPVFVMENVKGLLSATVRGEPVINRIVADLTHPKSALRNRTDGLSYRLYSLSEEEMAAGNVDPRLFLVKSEEYGVPQARHRMFIVGIREDLKVRPPQLRRHVAPTVLETIGDLPAIRSGLSRARDSAAAWRRQIEELASPRMMAGLNGAPFAQALEKDIHASVIRLDRSPKERAVVRLERRCSTDHPALEAVYDARLSAVAGHESRAHMGADLRRYMFAAVFAGVTGRSPKLSDFPEPLLPDHRNVDRGRAGKMFSDRFRVQLPGRVATTITSHISKDGHYFIHYDPLQCRSLTVREAARLQTFPDNYKFEGPRTAQFHQVGNAVPPYLAQQIASVIAEVLDTARVED